MQVRFDDGVVDNEGKSKPRASPLPTPTKSIGQQDGAPKTPKSSKQSVKKCPNCGGTDTESDPQRGDTACVSCGTVLEENTIVAEVTFQEDSRGRASVIGQHVRADGRPAGGLGVLGGFARESSELTIANARRKILYLASALNLSSHHTESALRLFRLGAERNFHKGRKLGNVCSAALYVVCRMEKTPHMLLDFSDVLQANLYELGSSYLKFVRLLSLDLPLVDPSLYIHRFASKLEFGDSTHDVAMSALRMIAVMKRDWMSHGRRPTGLCGAALLIAARFHNFFRTKREVVRVVRIGAAALQLRLNELLQNESSKLTLRQLNASGGEDGREESLRFDLLNETGEQIPKVSDPPAFSRSQRLKTQQNDAGDSVEGDPSRMALENQQMELSAELAITESRTRKRKSMGALHEAENVNAVQKQQQEVNEEEKEEGEEEELDEDDIDGYLLDEEEQKIKESMWTELNRDYLQQQEEFARMEAEDPQQYKRLKPWKVRNTTKKRKQSSSEPHDQNNTDQDSLPKTPVEAATRLLQRRSSNKLNYSVLENLLGKETLEQ
mmetsp:Transcript_1000/g.1892  ORF Transcript_1000/g.1892 Transcript_1000/m.1892 type:complete len:554 (-) Transcript_1000:353-2014(-)